MKELKREILFVLLFMVIGIAAVTTNVVIDMSTPINQNPDDFLVYFSDVKVNGTQDLTLVRDETKLVFDGEFSAVGDKKIVTYDVTNASKDYDANITINCTKSNDYLIIANSFDIDNVLSARSTRTGTLSIELKNAVSEETTQDVTCTISAIAAERESQGSGDVNEAVSGPYMIGYEIAIGDELFNVIEVSDDEVQLLAKQALSVDYKQSDGAASVFFADSGGWEYTPGPKEIDIQQYGSNVKTYVNGYVEYLKELTGYNNISGDLISVSQLGELGCNIPLDYSFNSDLNYSCYDSKYESWLIDDFMSDYWWTKSAVSNKVDNVWYFNYDSLYFHVGYRATTSIGYMYVPTVRPVITVDRSIYAELVSREFELVINGDTYTFLEGMTWGDWVESSYNTTNATIDSSGYVNIDNFYYLFIGPNFVFADDLVDRNSTYEFADGIQ